MEMESAKEPVLSVYPPMRWVKYKDGVMILQVLTVIGEGKSAWLNVPMVDASSVYLESGKETPMNKDLDTAYKALVENDLESLREVKMRTSLMLDADSEALNLGGNAEVKADRGTFSLDEAKADKKSKFWGRKK